MIYWIMTKKRIKPKRTGFIHLTSPNLKYFPDKFIVNPELKGFGISVK